MQIDLVLEVEDSDALIAIDFLVDNIELSKSKLKDMMNKGAVWHVDGKKGNRRRLRRAMTDIAPGDRFEVFYDEELLAIKPPLPRLIADETHYSVWDKPPGVLSQGTDWGDHAALPRLVELYFTPRREVFLIHRLDREASGLMILAHSRKAAAQLSQLFAAGDAVAKRYRVEVLGDIKDEGVINSEIEGKSALTRFKKLKYEAEPNRSTLDVWIETGRKHQIRRHFDGIGHPVIGDPRYGEGNKSNEGMKLKAVEMSFDCPITSKPQRFSLL